MEGRVGKCVQPSFFEISMTIKNSEGYDQIPQRILIDGIDILINPLSQIFALIYRDKLIPEQWLIAKITPIHKKDSKNNVENYSYYEQESHAGLYNALQSCNLAPQIIQCNKSVNGLDIFKC